MRVPRTTSPEMLEEEEEEEERDIGGAEEEVVGVEGEAPGRSPVGESSGVTMVGVSD